MKAKKRDSAICFSEVRRVFFSPSALYGERALLEPFYERVAMRVGGEGGEPCQIERGRTKREKEKRPLSIVVQKKGGQRR